MSRYTLQRGNAPAAVSVMLEAAAWLESRGMPLWTPGEIERLPQRYPADAFLTLHDGDQAAAAALLTDSDPLFWPDVLPGTSGFLHKLSVRRAYAGNRNKRDGVPTVSLALLFIEHAARICKNEGKAFLRLDCDASREKLAALYLSAGFALIGQRQAHTQTHGTVTAALFERAL